MALPIGTARLLGIFFTDILLGMHLITFFNALWIQLFRHREKGRRPNWLLIAVTLAMGIIGILNAGTDLALNNQVFVVTGGDVSLYTDLAYWMNLVQDLCMILQPIIGDAMLVYRFWAVYGRRWKATVPFILLWLAASSMMITIIPVFGETASCILTYSTALIAYRLWTVGRAVRAHIIGRRRLQLVMRVVIESGLLYTITAIVFLGTTISKSNADYVFGGVAVQITGIAFNLIIIRVTHRLATEDADESNTEPSTFVLDTLTSNQPNTVSAGRDNLPVHIRISRHTEADGDIVFMK
ncbi:hypothetical protein OBBRIDRAFT_879092 [Obba rivulosa]|uniref:Uncharacterized protein n=1 Tax=Obba rivulosa TaxID=1052685 RepID=A0A8E2AXI5_9APHY|nr:hypothetical protein OBBRIDRAFT_879092 [Obba rivulosa]